MPPIPPPPPLDHHMPHMGPAVPPRRAGEMLQHHLLADPYSVSAIPHTARSEGGYNEFDGDFEPQFLVQTPSGNVFVPPGGLVNGMDILNYTHGVVASCCGRCNLLHWFY